MPQIKREEIAAQREEIAAQFAACMYDNKSRTQLYRKLALQYHPDKHDKKLEEQQKATDAFQMIADEYEKSNEKAAEETKRLENLAEQKVEEYSRDPYFRWMYKRFFLYGDKELFEEIYIHETDSQLAFQEEAVKDKKQQYRAYLSKHIGNISNDILALNQKTVNTGSAALLCLIYAVIFAIFATSIQTALFGAIFLGGSILTNILFGAVAAIIATPIAITISMIRKNIDSNKLFNLLLFISILSAFTVLSPTIELLLLGKIIYTTTLSYQLMFGLAAATITYNVLNIIEIIIKNLLPSKIFLSLSLIKDLVRELSLLALFSPTGDILISIILDVQICLGIKQDTKLDCIQSYSIKLIKEAIGLILLPIITSYTCAFLYPIIGSSIIYGLVIYVIYCTLYASFVTRIANTPQLELPTWHIKFIELAATPFSYAYDFIQTHLDKSTAIENIAGSIFTTYRANIPAKLKVPVAQNKYLKYVIAVTFIVQAAIDLALLPIFMVTYPIYKAVKLITKTMQEVGGNNPKKTAAFFIITAALCATFASPIQLFVLGHIVMAGSPVINVMFGTLASLASTLFGANACALTNAYVKPSLSNAFAASSTAFNDLYTSLVSCLRNSNSPKPKK